MRHKTQLLKIKHYSLILVMNNFFHEKFPTHLKFSVVSVDCQHTLWNVPTVKNGRENIQFLDKRFIKKIFKLW